MPRTYKRKRVPILSGNNDYDASAYVDIPVVFEIDLIGTNAQVFRYRFHNDSTTQLRTVRVQKVGNASGSFGDATVTTDSYVNAERILTLAFSNSVEQITFMGKPVLYNQAWRTDKKLKNFDPAPKQPDGSDDPRHLQVHYVRYYKNNDIDEAYWIDVELIDKMEILATQAQEYTYKLRWPTAEEYAEMGGDDFGEVVDDEDDPYEPIIGFCPTEDENGNPIALLGVEFGENGKPVDVRLDPFQNICNVGGGDNAFMIGGFAPQISNRIFNTELSTDGGTNWEANSATKADVEAAARVIIYGDGIWMVIANGLGNLAFTSSDGRTWTPIVPPTNSATVGCFGSIKNKDDQIENVFLFANNDGFIYRSINKGLTWSLVKQINSFCTYFGFINGKFYLGTGDDFDSDIAYPFLWTSVDGINWTDREKIFTGIDIAPRSEGGTGYITGMARRPETKNAQNQITSPELWVLSGAANTRLAIATSSNGISWSGGTIISQDISAVGGFQPSICYSKTTKLFITCGHRNFPDSATGIILTSSDAASWTKVFELPTSGSGTGQSISDLEIVASLSAGGKIVVAGFHAGSETGFKLIGKTVNSLDGGLTWNDVPNNFNSSQSACQIQSIATGKAAKTSVPT